MRIYLASPLGFADSTKSYMETLKQALMSDTIEIVNPWDDHQLDDQIDQAKQIPDRNRRIANLDDLGTEMSRKNEEKIRKSDMVVAVLDGVDVDSGTASEIGFAYALGKRILGLRTDFRLSGETEAAKVNLQVKYWIEASRGQIVHDLGALKELVYAFEREPESGNSGA